MEKERHTLGSAYVQIVPSAEGIAGSIHKVLGGEADSAGTSAGKTIANKIKNVLATAAIGETLRQSILQGAALEQSLGGAETLFKEHADAVISNADKAYKTAGLSANEYMENATSFAASLLQSVSGNTEKAANLADMALVDMSDNANKMGTSMDRITDAYQGFAKQNYTMLDNLKLGYGGTKTEMERLLADATKLSGIEYNIDNLADVYSAIHVIQEEMDITGTTAKEASETLTGSFASMSSAAKNFLGNIVLGREVESSMIALAETASVFLFDNLIPAVGNVIKSLPPAVFALVTEGGPEFASSGLELIKGVVTGIVDGLPSVLEEGKETLSEFCAGISENIPILIDSTDEVIDGITGFIGEHLPEIFASGGEILGTIAWGILENIPQLLMAAGEVTGCILNALVELIPSVLEAGVELVGGIATGIIEGISSKLSSAVEDVKETLVGPIEDAKSKIGEIVEKIKSFFDITLSFDGIKLPHIEMSWKTSGIIAEAAQLLGIPGVPDFDVNWYKTGGIFDEPSIIGVGEAGTEAVVPLDKLWSKLDNFIGQRVNVSNPLTENQIRSIVTETINGVTVQIIDAMSNVKVEHTTNIDGRTVAISTAPFMNSKLGRLAELEERSV